MPRVTIPAVGLLLGSAVLGATVLGAQGGPGQIANAILSVRVLNTPEEAVPVREQRALQPVQVLQFGSFLEGERFSSEESLYTVPEGKTLVIEAFSVSSNMSANDRFMDARLEANLDNEEFIWFLHPTDEGVFSGTDARIFRGSAQAGGYAGPGTTVTAAATRDGTSLSGTAVGFRMVGHLVDTP